MSELSKLEQLATAVAIEAPRYPRNWACYVPRDLIEKIRAELERRGYGWRALQKHARQLEAEQRRASER